MPAFHFSSGPRLPEGIPGSWPSKSTLSAHTLTETSTHHGTSNAEPGLCSSGLGDLMAVRAMSRGSLPKQGHGSSSSLQIASTQRKETLLIVNLDNVIIPLVPWNFVFLHLLVDTCTANSLGPYDYYYWAGVKPCRCFSNERLFASKPQLTPCQT